MKKKQLPKAAPPTSDEAEPTHSNAGKRKRDDEIPESQSIFVKGLPYDSSDESIRALFADCGTISELNVPTFEDSGRCRGFAHITFETIAEARAAIALDGSDVGGRSIGVDFARPPVPAAVPTKTVFVANLSPEADDAAIRAVFDGCGDIVSVRIALDRATGAPRGFACVEFADLSGSEAALTKVGEVVKGRPIRIDYAIERESVGAARASDGSRGGRSRGRGGAFGSRGRGRGGFSRSR